MFDKEIINAIIEVVVTFLFAIITTAIMVVSVLTDRMDIVIVSIVAIVALWNIWES